MNFFRKNKILIIAAAIILIALAEETLTKEALLSNLLKLLNALIL